MSRLKIALSELEANDADHFRAALGRLTGRLSHYWEWSDLAHAELVIVDMDSMFGHMAWLKAHGAGKHVITFARSGQVQGSDLVLGKPLDDDALAAVLEEAAGLMDHSADALRGTDAAPAPKAPPVAAPAPRPKPAPKQAHPAEARTASVMNLAAAADAPPPPAAAAPIPAPVAAPAPATAPEPEPVNIADLLVRRPPAHAARVGGSDLVVDPERDVYYADEALKPLKEPLEQPTSALKALDAGALAAARQRKPLPLARLRWFCGLVATPGKLAHGMGDDERYKLARWPQTEREFPRHFRVATAMMKEAATPADLAAASGVPVAEVIDYINASKAAGWLAIERDEPPPAEDEGTSKAKGFFRKTLAR
ncbi:MAG TPA: hypothetical protein VF022_06205 [Rhodanobacteraceae bacterium]